MPLMNIGETIIANCMTGVTMHLRQIWEILKNTNVNPQIHKHRVGPPKGKIKIEVSVLPKVL